MGALPNRSYAVISKTGLSNTPEGVVVYSYVEEAIEGKK